MRTSEPHAGQRATKVFAAAGVIAAILFTVLLNVFFARHYRRWDVTSHQLYSLSPATIETLRGLKERIELDVLLPYNDPLAASVRFMLAAYQSHTDRLDVRYVDPDRHPAEFLALQQRYGIEAGQTEDGRVVMDASFVFSRSGSKPFFVSANQLVEARDGEDNRARSRVEQVFTGTLRNVVDDERPKVCFVSGHGEKRLDDGSLRGLGDFADRMKKNNYDAQTVDTSAPDAGKDPLSGCRVAVIAGPSEPLSSEEAARIRGWVERGGNLFVLANPVPDSDKKRMLPLNLDAVTAVAGIALDEDFVFETDAARKLPGGFGEQFLAQAAEHEVTASLAGERNQDLKILMTATRSLSRVESSKVVPATLLVTSKDAFGMVDFFAWASRGGAPEKAPGDKGGPLTLAMAAELPLPKGGSAAHGPRVVVVGSASLALGQNWQERALRGGAIFTESAISWLSARPPILDIPDKPAVAGARINESSLGEVLRYVVIYMPGAAALLGLAVYLRRRSTEGRARAGGPLGKET